MDNKRKLSANSDKENDDPCPSPKQKKSSSALNEDKIDKFISENSKKIDKFISHAKKDIVASTSTTSVSHGNKSADLNNKDKHSDSSAPALKKKTQSDVCLIMAILDKAKLSAMKSEAGLYVSFSDLIETVIDSNNDILIENVKNMALRMLTPDALKILLKKLALNFDKYITCGPIIEMFEYRKKWLRDEIKYEPEREFSWRMPHVSIPGHPEVENFLKGDGQHLRYIIGISAEYARVFCAIFGNENNEHYSARMSCSGAGKDTYVTIEKTKAYFEKYAASYIALIEEYKQEIESINLLLARRLI